MGHAASDLVQLDCLTDVLQVLLCVNLFHAQGRLLVVASSESLIVLALDTLQVHFHSQVHLLCLFVAVRCLLVKLLCLVLAVSLAVEHVAEEAALELGVGFASQLSGSDEEIGTDCFNHFELFFFI